MSLDRFSLSFVLYAQMIGDGALGEGASELRIRMGSAGCPKRATTAAEEFRDGSGEPPPMAPAVGAVEGGHMRADTLTDRYGRAPARRRRGRQSCAVA